MRGVGEAIVESRAGTEDERRRQTTGPSLTRRQLLAGTGQVALLALVPFGCAPVSNKAWSDGTFWDDGFGWTA